MKSSIKNLISSILILATIAPSFIFMSVPRKAEAIPVLDIPHTVISGITSAFSGISAFVESSELALKIADVAKDLGEELLKSVAKQALKRMTQDTVAWINNGYHGAPLFVENKKTFFRDIAKSEIKDFVETTGYDSVRFPFGKQYALEVINSYKSQFEDNAAYSLSNVISDPDTLYRLQTDFSFGGWNGFLMNTQYPQNNYVGYRILASENLGKRLDGTSQSIANRVRETLDEGMGFLSPEVCLSNPSYNNLKNQFQRPSFTAKTPYTWTEDPAKSDEENERAKASYDVIHKQMVSVERSQWAKENTCPEGLVATTPGSVVSSQITSALGSNFRQTELGQALGGSLSAVFDAVISKLASDGIDSGLRALTKKTNPAVAASQESDDLDYYGASLGTAPTNVNGYLDPFSGPDQEISMKEFLPEITKGVADTEKELALIYNTDPLNPGIIQVADLLPPTVQSLDQCTPGPDKGWEERLQKEFNRNIKILQDKSILTSEDFDDEKKKAQALLADRVMEDLRYTVAHYKDWLYDKMLVALPSSVNYMDSVKDTNTIYQELAQFDAKRRMKSQALARLKAIEVSLKVLYAKLGNQDPVRGSAEEKELKSLASQYLSIRNNVSSPTTIQDMQSELNFFKDELNNMRALLEKCTQERIDAKWDQYGGLDSVNQNEKGKPVYYVDQQYAGWKTYGTEVEQFCELPMEGGRGYGNFEPKTNPVWNADLLMINADDVFEFKDGKGLGGFLIKYFTVGGLFGWDKKDVHVDIRLDCRFIFEANDIDYSQAGNTGF